jgi:uncharacterized protein YlzI (FlbEa/FlbD family)
MHQQLNGGHIMVREYVEHAANKLKDLEKTILAVSQMDINVIRD